MRPVRLFPLALLVALFAIPGTASAGSCSGSVYGWTHITAPNTTCARAKSVIRDWIEAETPERVGAYTCDTSEREGPDLICTASRGRKVTARQGPIR